MVGNPYAVSWSLHCILDHNKYCFVIFVNMTCLCDHYFISYNGDKSVLCADSHLGKGIGNYVNHCTNIASKTHCLTQTPCLGPYLVLATFLDNVQCHSTTCSIYK